MVVEEVAQTIVVCRLRFVPVLAGSGFTGCKAGRDRPGEQATKNDGLSYFR